MSTLEARVSKSFEEQACLLGAILAETLMESVISMVPLAWFPTTMLFPIEIVYVGSERMIEIIFDPNGARLFNS